MNKKYSKKRKKQVLKRRKVAEEENTSALINIALDDGSNSFELLQIL